MPEKYTGAGDQLAMEVWSQERDQGWHTDLGLAPECLT